MKKTKIQPNLQLIYVADIERSMEFYSCLFEAKPVFQSPRYVAFSAGGEALFALWSGGAERPEVGVPRFSEVGIMLSSDEEVDELFIKWQESLDLEVIQEPCTEVFGRTFLVADPDGHVIRVCPLDQ